MEFSIWFLNHTLIYLLDYSTFIVFTYVFIYVFIFILFFMEMQNVK